MQSRGGKGITNYHIEKYGKVAAIKVVDLDDDIIMISSDGVIIRIEASSIRICARPSKGVRVMRVDGEENRVVTLARAPHDEEAVTHSEIEDDGGAESAEDLVEDEPEEGTSDGEPETDASLDALLDRAQEKDPE